MKKNKFFYLILLLHVTSLPVIGQESQTSLSTAKLLTAAREIIAEAGNCALISLDNDGRPRARTMDPFAPEDDFSIWFGTNTESRKVKQIKNNSLVTLYYFDKSSGSYVSLYGQAEIIDSGSEIKKYWKEEWAAFYPDYPKGYALIKVTPQWLEVISEIRGINGDTITWQPPKVDFTKEKQP